ncbi:MAG TPA: hypothetical protein VEX11_08135 [Acetobacteraceae bacterium]|nr:hypothetical protein [Acetobacteraceae bacterium]
MAPRHSGAALLAVVAIIASMPVLADLAQLGPARRRGPAPRPVARSGGGHRPHGAAGRDRHIVNYEPVVYFLAGLPLPTRMPLWPQLASYFGGPSGRRATRNWRACWQAGLI